MSNKILLKRTSSSGKVITSSQLDYGELAINYADGNLQWKDSNNSVHISPLDVLPPQEDQGGKYLTTDGSDVSWALPPDAIVTTSFVTSSETSSYTVAGNFGALQVYYDGVLATEGETYSVSGNVVTFSPAVPAGIELKFVKYKSLNLGAQPPTFTTYNEVVTGSAKSEFNMPGEFAAIQVYLNGVLCSANDSYTVVGQKVTFTDPVPVGEEASFVLYQGDVISTQIAWGNVTGTPTTVAGYGITDVRTAAVPSQSGQSGKFLTTNGSETSWGAIDLSGKMNVSGSRGALAGYQDSGTATTINDSSADCNEVSAAVTISNGTSGKAWTKVVRLTSAVSVTLGSSWGWVGGEAPNATVAGAMLVCCWCGSAGLVSYVSPTID